MDHSSDLDIVEALTPSHARIGNGIQWRVPCCNSAPDLHLDDWCAQLMRARMFV